MRHLATIRKISDILPIVNADVIEVAVVDGWKVVVKKNEFKIGDVVIYCEIDSWIPHNIAPFLSKDKDPREYNGVKGEVLRTVRLRGQLSQGLLLPLSDVAGSIGDDVSEQLNIQKWEPPIPAQLAGEVRGLFPSFVPKTDQERIQNLSAEIADWNNQDLSWEVTEKLDGSSMTVYDTGDDYGVCSRNLNLRETEGNTLWKVARELKLFDGLSGYALQGELIGEGIQGNPYKIRGQTFRLFDIYNINEGRYLTPSERQGLFWSVMNIPHVPVLEIYTQKLDIDNLLSFAEGKSALNNSTEREGLVFKCKELPGVSFKVISNKFLLKK
jgi:RNA ligase (TIGR02306 family)